MFRLYVHRGRGYVSFDVAFSPLLILSIWIQNLPMRFATYHALKLNWCNSRFPKRFLTLSGWNLVRSFENIFRASRLCRGRSPALLHICFPRKVIVEASRSRLRAGYLATTISSIHEGLIWLCVSACTITWKILV